MHVASAAIELRFFFSTNKFFGGSMSGTTKEVSRFMLFLLLAAVLAVAPLSAQEATGRIVGVVYDPTGAVIAGAHVVATNVSTHISRETTSDASGAYQILALPIGDYTVSVDRKGFSAVKTSANTLNINQSLKIDIKLPVGSAAESVIVETSATTVETISPTVGVTISSSAIQNLPLNGRNVLDLAL